MSRCVVCLTALGLMFALSGSVAAAPDPGQWEASGSDLLSGAWLQTFGAAGHEGTVDDLEVSIEREYWVLSLDIKPGSCPNPLNIRSKGKLPVALLGTDDFDVFMIDLATIMLSRGDGMAGGVAPLEGPPGVGLAVAFVLVSDIYLLRDGRTWPGPPTC